jgi:GAF domain-containing protein
VLDHDIGPPVAVGRIAVWIGDVLGAPYALALLAVLLLLAPDGHLPSRRWRPLLLLVVGSFGLTVIAMMMISPDRLRAGGPGTVEQVPLLVRAAGEIGITIGLLGAAAAMIVRLRRARGEQRRQLRWIAVAALLLAVAVVVTVAVNLARGSAAGSLWFITLLLGLGYLAVPVATGFAVLRHRLYDIDVIIGSAVRLAVLATFVTVGYVAVVVAIGSVVGGGPDVWPSLLAYVLVALAFQPLRRRVDQLADRVVHGARAAPYDSLADFTRRLGRGPSDPQMPALVARACAEVAGATHAVASVAVPGAADLTATWPDGPAVASSLSIPVRHRDEQLGEIGLIMPPGRQPTRTQRRLLEEFATQAGLAFRNVGLTAALQARAAAVGRDRDELAASRRRLVHAADTERRRIAAAIRRDVTGPLEPMPSRLGLLATRVLGDPAGVARSIQEQEDLAARSVEALRTITGGVLPPLLARRGLAAAVRSSVRPPTTAVVGGGIVDRRFDTGVEVATYVCCVEAVRGMRPGAELTVDVVDDELLVVVRGHPTTGDDSELGFVDRVAALGGQVAVAGVPGGPSSVRAAIPVTSAHTAVSRSEPKTDFRT